MEGGDVISMHDLYVYKQTGVDDSGNALGHFRATGIRPKCLEKLETAGVRLPVEVFADRTLGA